MQTKTQPKHLWKPGQSGNPKGRPKGTGAGRIKALATLDSVLAEPKCQERIREAMRKAILGDPLKFWKEIIAPLLPKHATLDLGVSNAEEIRELGRLLREQVSARAIPEESIDAEIVDPQA